MRGDCGIFASQGVDHEVALCSILSFSGGMLFALFWIKDLGSDRIAPAFDQGYTQLWARARCLRQACFKGNARC